MKKFKNYCTSDKIFYISAYLIATIIFLIVLYPFIYVVSASFSSAEAINSGKVILWPVDISMEGYKIIFRNKDIFIGLKNSVIYTVLGTVINLVMTMTAAYCLSREDVPGAKGILFMFTFTMFVSGNIITNYMLIRSLKLLNTMWSLVLPGAISAYNLIIARSFIMSSIPKELFEAAVVDGCSDIKYYLDIVLPLSKPVIAVLTLFCAVTHWNSYFNPMIYLSDRDKFPLALFLKEILISTQIDPSSIVDPEMAMKIATMAQQIQYALIVVTVIPIILIYPFIQKHFAKGIMLGSVKG